MTLLLFTVGEIVEQNIVTIVLAVIGWAITMLGAVFVMVWRMSQAVAASRNNGTMIEQLTNRFQAHEEDFDHHKSDDRVHTTFEYRQSVNARFDRIEDTMKEGHNRIENKIDAAMNALLRK